MLKSILEIKSKFAQINQTLQFDHIVYTIEEEMAITRLRDKDKTVLLIAFPDYIRKSSQDNPQYETGIALWVITKEKTGSQTFDRQDEIMDELLAKLNSLIDAMEEQASEGCDFFATVKFDTIEINPVYNAFGGFMGWIMLFTMK